MIILLNFNDLVNEELCRKASRLNDSGWIPQREERKETGPKSSCWLAGRTPWAHTSWHDIHANQLWFISAGYSEFFQSDNTTACSTWGLTKHFTKYFQL